MAKLTIIANLITKTDKIDQVKAEFQKLLEITRAQDEGCITYDLHQDNEDPTKFLVFEIWASEALLQKHANSDHFKAFITTTEDMLALFTVNTMTQIA